jgi:hypothetical protein
VVPQTTTQNTASLAQLEWTPTTHYCPQSPYHILILLSRPKMHPELIVLEQTFNLSGWHVNHALEPVVGHPACPKLAEKYGIRGKSCYTALVEDKHDGTHGCRYERCHAFLTYSLDDAIRHQRYHHFDHRPFMCIPPNGRPW